MTNPNKSYDTITCLKHFENFEGKVHLEYYMKVIFKWVTAKSKVNFNLFPA